MFLGEVRRGPRIKRGNGWVKKPETSDTLYETYCTTKVPESLYTSSVLNSGPLLFLLWLTFVSVTKEEIAVRRGWVDTVVLDLEEVQPNRPDEE